MEDKKSYNFQDDEAFRDSFKTMSDFRRETVFTDVTIVCDDGREFHCHKVVLASASAYFRAMFLTDMKESQQAKINVKDVNAAALGLLLDFCYTSTIDITADNVQHVFVASGMLQFPNIQDSCMAFLLQHIDETNCIGIWKLAEIIQRNRAQVMKKLECYIRDNFSYVIKHDEFLDLSMPQFSRFVESDDINITSEDDVCTAVLRWARHDGERRATHLPELMKCVRFASLTRRYLIDVVAQESSLMADEYCRKLVYEAIRYHLLPESRSREEEGDAPAKRPREKLRRFLYLLGGEECGSIVNKAEYFDSSSESWHEVTPMIVARKLVATAVLDNQLYAVGGLNDQYGDLVTAEVCDLSTNQWTSMASLEECKGAVAVAILDGWLYAAGGSHNGTALKTVERYNAQLNQWTQVPSMNLPRSHFGLQPLSGKLYAIGGYCGTCAIPHVEHYDPLANNWTEVASLNKPRMNHGSTHFGGKIYVVGGASSCGVLNSIEVFDSAVNHWSFVRNRFNPRSGVSLSILRTQNDSEAQLWIIGGHDYKNRDYKSIVKLRLCDLSFQGELSLARACVFAGYVSV